MAGPHESSPSQKPIEKLSGIDIGKLIALLELVGLLAGFGAWLVGGSLSPFSLLYNVGAATILVYIVGITGAMTWGGAIAILSWLGMKEENSSTLWASAVPAVLVSGFLGTVIAPNIFSQDGIDTIGKTFMVIVGLASILVGLYLAWQHLGLKEYLSSSK